MSPFVDRGVADPRARVELPLAAHRLSVIAAGLADRVLALLPDWAPDDGYLEIGSDGTRIRAGELRDLKAAADLVRNLIGARHDTY